MAEVYGWEAIKGKVVMHLCDNPPCYRLSHLRIGTQTDNCNDMWAKGRARPGTTSGALHPAAKFTEADIESVRIELAAGTPGLVLARRYGVHHSTIYRIRDGRTWAA
jgi:hypothetical protein